MEKSKLSTFISKYHLGGLIQSVMWNSNGSLSTRFISSDKCIVGDVKLKSFSADPMKAGIPDTDRLLKLLSVLGEDVNLSFNASQDTAFSITLNDASTSVNYMLVVLDVIPNVPTFKKEPDYPLSITLNKNFIDKFIKAKAALPDEKQFTIVKDSKTGKYQAIIGYSNINTTRIAIDLDATNSDDNDFDEINFSVNYFKEVLASNKDCSDGIMKVSPTGIAKIEFKNDDFESKYFLASDRDNN